MRILIRIILLVFIILLLKNNIFGVKESDFISQAKGEMVFKLIDANNKDELRNLCPDNSCPFNLELKSPKFDMTPLEYAITSFNDVVEDINKEDRGEIIAWLIEKGANVNIVEQTTGKTFLHQIAELIKQYFYNLKVFNNIFRAFMLLIDKGIDPEVKDNEGKTFLDYIRQDIELDRISRENVEKMLESYILQKKGN